jgi:C1A family cysteine protease
MGNKTRAIVVATFAFVFAGASNCNNPLPGDAYNYATDPAPDRAQSLANADYDKLALTGRFYAISNRSIGEQEQAAAADEAKNDATIAAYLKAHPGAGKLIPDEPREGHVSKRKNGSYSHPIQYAHGGSSYVETMGTRWFKATLARAIKRTQESENQSSLEHLQTAPPQTLSPEDVLSVAPLTCAQEEGGADGGDRTGNSDTNPSCQPRNTGIFHNYAFPGKANLTCVKNQGNRGTCVAFGISSAIEYLFAKTNSRWVNLSEQALYERAKLAWARDDFADGLVTADVFVSSQGTHWPFPLETAWDYNPSPQRNEDDKDRLYTRSCDGYTGTCSNSSHQAAVYCTVKDKYRYCGFLGREATETVPHVAGWTELWNWLDHDAGLRNIQSALSAGNPVVWSFSVTPSWDAAGSDGFVRYQGSSEGNRGGHAVHVVGYIDNATLATVAPSAPQGSGGGYLIIKNSWTNCWGDGGYVYAPYDFVRSYTSAAESVNQLSR